MEGGPVKPPSPLGAAGGRTCLPRWLSRKGLGMGAGGAAVCAPLVLGPVGSAV